MVAVGPGNRVTSDSEPSTNPLLTALEVVRPAATIAVLVPVMPSIAGTMMLAVPPVMLNAVAVEFGTAVRAVDASIVAVVLNGAAARRLPEPAPASSHWVPPGPFHQARESPPWP